MIIDGRQIAEEILSALEKERGAFGALTLGVLMVSGDAATESFIKIKSRAAARLDVEVRRFGPGEMQQALTCDGIIVQMPIPNAEALIAALPPEKDVDALNKNSLVRPPVAEAIAEILKRTGVKPRGKRAVVVGAGRLVGAPAAKLLHELGADVEVVTNRDGSLTSLKTADIVVLGAGEPGLVKPEMLKKGVVLVDAGTSEAGGKLAGDADPSCADVCSVFTPVPGGIGPIAVAMIFKNLFVLAKAARK
ncbi:MAG: bifunctional 5,10-methylenetetrahydrofolate dehydrogenase/5,10-methenyltetrahydrofolate cyclohydrolase [Patescibacteria group bacterium]